MKFFLAVAAILFFSCSSTERIDSSGRLIKTGPRLGLSSKKKNKSLVQMPFDIVDVVFDYKKRTGIWPPSIELACIGRGKGKSYTAFMDRGMDELIYRHVSRDSLIVAFTYSKEKHAAYNGSREQVVFSSVRGNYVFVHDGSLTFFKTLLD